MALHHVTQEEISRAYRSLGLEPIFVEVAKPDDIEGAVAEAARRGASVLYMSAEPLLASNYSTIVLGAQKYSLPIVAEKSWMLPNGALMSYGPDDEDMQRQIAFVIDKVLRGANPATMPVQQPSKFRLGLNPKAAKTFGITISPSLMSRAEEIIQ